MKNLDTAYQRFFNHISDYPKFKKKKNKNTRFDRWDIKNGRKNHAEIYLLRSGGDIGRYQICLNGFAFYRDSLEEAKEFVINQTESFLNFLNFNTKVEIVEAH